MPNKKNKALGRGLEALFSTFEEDAQAEENVIELINNAVQTEHGNVVCIEKGNKLTFDIHYHIRLVEASEYDIADYTALKGFISAMSASRSEK